MIRRYTVRRVFGWTRGTGGRRHNTVDGRGCNAPRFACEGGHLKVAQWLATHFALTSVDARADNDWALRRALFKPAASLSPF